MRNETGRKLLCFIVYILRKLIYERIEEEQDIRDGMKALGEEDSMDWNIYKKSIKE